MSDMWDDWDPAKQEPARSEPPAPPAAQPPVEPPAANTPPPATDWPWNDVGTPAPPTTPGPPNPLDPTSRSQVPAPQAQQPVEQPSAQPAAQPVPVGGPSLAEGSTFGRYLLREYLGRGWQGETWIAEDTFVGCYVSLKLINEGADADAFLNNARFGVQLDDLSGVAMHDLGVVDGRAFLARTLVTDGLVEWLEDNGPLPVHRAISVAGNLASVLDAAHGAGIVHGNVKPSNVLFEVADDNNEYGYLVDFLAPPAAPGESRRVPAALVADTDCMAPEIVDGGVPSPQADQYGLACVVYTMLTGQTPFGAARQPGGGVEVTLPGATPRPITDINTTVAREAADVIARAMSPQPSARYANCAEFIETLYVALGSPAQGPSFDTIHPALPDPTGGPTPWADDFDEFDDDPMPWEDEDASPFGTGQSWDAPGAASLVPPPVMNPFDMPMPPMPPASPYDAPNPYGQPSASPYDAPGAFGQPPASPYDAPNPYAQPSASPYDAPNPYGQPSASPYDAPNPYAQPSASPYGDPGAFAPSNPYDSTPPQPYSAPEGIADEHAPWGAVPAGAAVVGEHDFEDDGYDYDYDEDDDDDEHFNTRSGESKRTAIGIAVLVGVVIIVALFLLVRMFTSSSAPSSPSKSTAAKAQITTPTGPAGLNSAESALAAQVQSTFRSTCKSAPGAMPGATAAITCTPTSGATKVTYAQYADKAAMNTQYQNQLKALGVAQSNGVAPGAPCASARVEEHPWRYGQDQTQPADGRYACGPLNKIATIVWTADAQRIVAVAERGDLDTKTLGDWWLKNGGPYPPAK